MLQPETLLDHADRLLNGAAHAADIRRAISASYYAVFHLLTLDAAACVSPGNRILQSRLRRAAQHRDMRKVCDTIASAGPQGPKLLAGVIEPPIAPELSAVAGAFATLQDARHAADYDLDTEPSFALARASRDLGCTVFKDWQHIRNQPNTQAFLVALLLADRWSRRG